MTVLDDGSVTTAAIADGAVTAPKLAGDAVPRLTASVPVIEGSQTVTLSWAVPGADVVQLAWPDAGIQRALSSSAGEIQKAQTYDVQPYADTTYTLTAFKGGVISAQCQARVSVVPDLVQYARQQYHAGASLDQCLAACADRFALRLPSVTNIVTLAKVMRQLSYGRSGLSGALLRLYGSRAWPQPAGITTPATITKALEIPSAAQGVRRLSTHFDEWSQLIAYTESSGTAVTTVVYDHAQRQRITSWAAGSKVKRIRFFNQGNNLAHDELTNTRRIKIFDANFQLQTSIDVTSGFLDFKISADMKRLLVADPQQVQVCDLQRGGKPLQKFTLATATYDGGGAQLALSGDEKEAVICGGYQKNTITYLNLGSGASRVIPTGTINGCYSPVWPSATDNRYVLVGGSYGDGGLYRVDLTSDQSTKIAQPSSTYLYSLDISPDDRYLACGGYDGRPQIYTTAGWTKVFSDTLNLINDLQFTRDGKYLVTAHGAGTSARVVVYEIASKDAAAEQAQLQATIVAVCSAL